MTLLSWRDLHSGITTHGFRSTFKDWASECTHTPNFVSEAALAHVVADKVEAAYRRADLLTKRRELMEEWAEFCKSAPTSKGSTRRTGAKVARIILQRPGMTWSKCWRGTCPTPTSPRAPISLWTPAAQTFLIVDGRAMVIHRNANESVEVVAKWKEEKPRNLTMAQFYKKYNVGPSKTYELVAEGALTLRKLGKLGA